LKHEIFVAVMNGDIKSCKSSSSLLFSDLVCVHVLVYRLKKQARRKTHI